MSRVKSSTQNVCAKLCKIDRWPPARSELKLILQAQDNGDVGESDDSDLSLLPGTAEETEMQT